MYKNMMSAVMTDALDEAVEKAQLAFSKIADGCPEAEQRDIRDALKQYRQAADGLGALIEQSLKGRTQRSAPSSTEQVKDDAPSSKNGSFDPMDILSRASRSIDGKTMEAGMEIMNGFVKMIDHMQKKRKA